MTFLPLDLDPLKPNWLSTASADLQTFGNGRMIGGRMNVFPPLLGREERDLRETLGQTGLIDVGGAWP